MDCPKLSELEPWIREELSDSRQKAIAEHLQGCRACRDGVAELRSNLNLAMRIAIATDADSSDPPKGGSPPTREKWPHPTSGHSQLPTGDSIPGYQIIRELNRGGQGVVYQAIQQSTKRKVAIKVLRDGHFANAGDRTRFEREVYVLGQLSHPNVITIFDSGSVRGNAFYVMDYVAGQSLDEYVKTQGHSFGVSAILLLFTKICDAVHAAHVRGIIHRDLKPSNIRVDDHGEPHVLDFGLAKIAGVSEVNDPVELTISGQFVGSVPWASPEQAEGHPGSVDIRTDVYALGVVLYQLLTGRFPYDLTGNIREVLHRIIHVEPPPPGSVDGGRPIHGSINDEVDTIVLKCLHKQRERRYQSAGEVARDVRHYLAGEAIDAKRDSGLYLLRKLVQRYRVPFAVSGAFVLVLVVALTASIWLWRRAERRERAASDAADCLAVLLHVKGDFHAAEHKFRDVLRKARAEDGERHQHTATAIHNLAGVLRAQGNFQEALEQYQESLKLRRAFLGKQHPLLAQSLMELAATLEDTGDYAEAEYTYREAASIRMPAGPEASLPRIAISLGLARVLSQQGRFSEAEKYLRRADVQLTEAADTPPHVRREVIEATTSFYEKWNEADPGGGHDTIARDWREKLHALEETPPTPQRP